MESNAIDLTKPHLTDLGDGVLIHSDPSVIVVTDSNTGEEVRRFTNWDDADDFIAWAMETGGEYDINETPL